MKLILPGVYTTLNEYIKAERTNKFFGAKIKRNETERVVWECRAQKISLVDKPSYFLFHWYLKDKRKDPDNVAFASKFILDGLVSAGVIWGDTQEHILGICHLFDLDKDNTRVELSTYSTLPKLLTSLK